MLRNGLLQHPLLQRVRVFDNRQIIDVLDVLGICAHRLGGGLISLVLVRLGFLAIGQLVRVGSVHGRAVTTIRSRRIVGLFGRVHRAVLGRVVVESLRSPERFRGRVVDYLRGGRFRAGFVVFLRSVIRVLAGIVVVTGRSGLGLVLGRGSVLRQRAVVTVVIRVLVVVILAAVHGRVESVYCVVQGIGESGLVALQRVHFLRALELAVVVRRRAQVCVLVVAALGIVSRQRRNDS